jgi:positive regulator of sigma E activity
MGYLKYTPYLYLVFAVFFIYEAIVKWNDSEATPWLSLMVAGLAIFMFFFRKKYAKKMHDRNNQS